MVPEDGAELSGNRWRRSRSPRVPSPRGGRHRSRQADPRPRRRGRARRLRTLPGARRGPNDDRHLPPLPDGANGRTDPGARRWRGDRRRLARVARRPTRPLREALRAPGPGVSITLGTPPQTPPGLPTVLTNPMGSGPRLVFEMGFRDHRERKKLAVFQGSATPPAWRTASVARLGSTGSSRGRRRRSRSVWRSRAPHRLPSGAGTCRQCAISAWSRSVSAARCRRSRRRCSRSYPSARGHFARPGLGDRARVASRSSFFGARRALGRQPFAMPPRHGDPRVDPRRSPPRSRRPGGRVDRRRRRDDRLVALALAPSPAAFEIESPVVREASSWISFSALAGATFAESPPAALAVALALAAARLARRTAPSPARPTPPRLRGSRLSSVSPLRPSPLRSARASSARAALRRPRRVLSASSLAALDVPATRLHARRLDLEIGVVSLFVAAAGAAFGLARRSTRVRSSRPSSRSSPSTRWCRRARPGSCPPMPGVRSAPSRSRRSPRAPRSASTKSSPRSFAPGSRWPRAPPCSPSSSI